MRKTHAGLAAVLALTLGGACARNPVSGRPVAACQGRPAASSASRTCPPYVASSA